MVEARGIVAAEAVPMRSERRKVLEVDTAVAAFAVVMASGDDWGLLGSVVWVELLEVPSVTVESGRTVRDR